ncbi:uncharacterized protein LOC122817841 [Drosophila biarmipes]|uniref:uncharacterized protein LOC122817841 n=1 Tax=Drosophila biarmipes TaxID=125945 RepID=UPI001CDB0B80|nr:uncharacterized protein LOC122817841 [Drosophila biarmipes]
MLFLKDGGNGHYMNIIYISRLMTQRGNQKRAQFFCNVCLNFSGTEEAALKHKTLCSRKVSKMPQPQNNTLEFTQVQHQLQVPFVVYADFECILEPKNFEALSINMESALCRSLNALFVEYAI